MAAQPGKPGMRWRSDPADAPQHGGCRAVLDATCPAARLVAVLPGVDQQVRCFQHGLRCSRLASGRAVSYSSATEQKRGLPVRMSLFMQLVFCSMCALSVAVIFYGWRELQSRQEGREKQLRARVAYMLWVVATGDGD